MPTPFADLSGWFWVDLPSSIPPELLDMLLEGGNPDSDSGGGQMLRLLRLVRLLRLLKLLKVGEYIVLVEERFDINLSFLRIGQMVLSLLYLAHLLGCFWFYVASLQGLDPDIVTWVSTYDDGSALYGPSSTQYLFSLYWALTTLTTVGYGDITPTNNAERYYALFALLVGAIVFGFMLSSIGELVHSVDKQAALAQDRMDEIKEYMRWRKLPRDLVVRLRRYYTFYYSRKTAFDEDQILGGLTPALRLEVVKHSLKDTIGKIPLFADIADPMFQLQVFPLLKPISVAPGEVIHCKGDISHDLLFLIKGRVEVLSGIDHRVLYVIEEGEFFGESVLTGRRRLATHRVAHGKLSELFALSSTSLDELFTLRPREGRQVYDTVMKELHRKELMRNISLRLTLDRFKADPSKSEEEVAAMQLQMGWNNRAHRMVANRVAQIQQEGEKDLTDPIVDDQITPYRPHRNSGDDPHSPGGLGAPKVESEMEHMREGQAQLKEQVEGVESSVRQLLSDQASIKASLEILVAQLGQPAAADYAA